MNYSAESCSEKSMLLLRTHYFDTDMTEACERLAKNAGMPFAVIADETRGKVDVPGTLRKLTIDAGVLAELGLLVCINWGWRCGDYFLAWAEQNFPDVDYFWMTEPDVYLRFDDIREFFKLFDHAHNVDLIAPAYGNAPDSWAWHSSVKQSEGQHIKMCLFPLVRVSSRLIRHVHEKRIADKTRFPEDKWKDAGVLKRSDWPNDEAIVSNAAADAGFTGKNLNEFGPLYDSKTFSFGLPISLKFLNKENQNQNRVFHPVLAGDRYVNKLKERFQSQITHEDDIKAVNARFSTREMLVQIMLEKDVNGIEEFARFKNNLTPKIREEKQKRFRREIVSKIWRDTDPFSDAQKKLNPVDLQGWNSQHPYLGQEIQRLNPEIIIEVGVWKGASSIFMAKNLIENNNVGLIIAVDTWLGSWDHWQNQKWFDELRFDAGYPSIYRTFCANVFSEKMEEMIVPLPLDSVNAAHILQRYSLFPKLVHLDGGHDQVAVMTDLRVWWPLLQSGGTLIGDDYSVNGAWPGVRRAFDEFFAETPHVVFEHADGKCRVRKP